MLWMLLLAGSATLLSGEATAQTGRDGPRRSGFDPIVGEWALRGVVISDAGRSAVLEHLPSGRQELREKGAVVTHSVAVVTIDADRVVLSVEGGHTVTLRMGHGGQGRVFRRPVPVVRRVPPAMLGRRQGR